MWLKFIKLLFKRKPKRKSVVLVNDQQPDDPTDVQKQQGQYEENVELSQEEELQQFQEQDKSHEYEIETPIKNDTVNTDTTPIEEYEDDMPPEFSYLEQLIYYRLDKYFPSPDGNIKFPRLPDYKSWKLPLADFIIKNNLNNDEAVVLLRFPRVPCILFFVTGSNTLATMRKTESSDLVAFLTSYKTGLIIFNASSKAPPLSVVKSVSPGLR